MKLELTDKTGEAFTKYLYNNKDLKHFINIRCGLTTQNFKLFPLAMQIGVLQLFFDSVGMIIEIEFVDNIVESKGFRYWVDTEKQLFVNDIYETRQEAWIEGVKKANEIFNNRK